MLASQVESAKLPPVKTAGTRLSSPDRGVSRTVTMELISAF